MAGSQAWPMTADDDVQFLVRDLEVISGTLTEIATCWRRALRTCQSFRSAFPFGFRRRRAIWRLASARSTPRVRASPLTRR